MGDAFSPSSGICIFYYCFPGFFLSYIYSDPCSYFQLNSPGKTPCPLKCSSFLILNFLSNNNNIS